MRTTPVTLDNQTFTVEELRSRVNSEWRAKLEKEFGDLADLIESAPGVDLTSAAGVASLVRSVSGQVLKSVDRLTKLLIEYAPQLRDVVGDAYDSELLDAFVEVLKLAYPFGTLVEKVRAIGRALPPTGRN